MFALRLPCALLRVLAEPAARPTRAPGVPASETADPANRSPNYFPVGRVGLRRLDLRDCDARSQNIHKAGSVRSLRHRRMSMRAAPTARWPTVSIETSLQGLFP